MFYQNSNDLVKNASISSGHLQNSSQTRDNLIKNIRGSQGSREFRATNDVNDSTLPSSDSLNFGVKFQNIIQGIIQSVSNREGMETNNSEVIVNNTVKQSNTYTDESIEYINKKKSIMAFIAKKEDSGRNKWVEVTDSKNVVKYGYIDQNGIFQIWNAPSAPSSNWLETDTMKKNKSVCPVASNTFDKIRIAGSWDDIKPFQFAYSPNDSQKTNPLFMVTNTGVRIRNDGLTQFSCGNETSNVFVTERPSADFQFPGQDGVDAIQMGCYVLNNNMKDSDIKSRGFTFQEDLENASISQCKRRAEDLGSTYFLLSAPEQGKPNNRGGCWIYTGKGKPNIDGLMALSSDENKCTNVGNKEEGEDKYLSAYSSTDLKRMYGKNHYGSSLSFVGKRTGMWGGEAPNEYTCKGAKGRNITGNWGDFERYCLFDKEEDAKNWCSSDPTCLGYVNNRPNMYQVTRKPVVNPYGGIYYEKNAESKTSKSLSLYALKSGGTTGVDVNDQNKPGGIGKIAYIDHNGERHEYPSSALSFLKPTKENPIGKYISLGGYDTRSSESSYSLKEVSPGSLGEPVNLLYKGARDGWSPQKFHELCDNKGATYTRVLLMDGRVLGAYTSVSWTSPSEGKYVNDPNAFLYDGENKYYSTNGYDGPGVMATYHMIGDFPLFGRGNDMYIDFYRTLYMNARTFLASNGRAPFTKRIQQAKMYGPWITTEENAFPTEIVFLGWGYVVYAFYDGYYTKMVPNWAPKGAKYYVGKLSEFSADKWDTYSWAGDNYRLKYIDEYKEYPRKLGFYMQQAVSDIEVYSVDANIFPHTNPPDYIRRVRTMPIGENVTASKEKCMQMCDADDKCGGIVYTKANTGAGDGKCELKDKAKMYPVGVRIADPSKELLLKVPTINAGIGDDTCRANNGSYVPIDTIKYAHYPNTGDMSSSFKCNIENIVPRDGTTQEPSTSGIIEETNKQINITQQKTTEYQQQTSGTGGGSSVERFTLREGLSYLTTMQDVSNNLMKIANAEYQRERFNAMSEETNKALMAESYKFILWSVLAILTILALLKLKEMFGQDEADEGGEGGGILATIIGWFGFLKGANTSDVPDATENVKAALGSAGEQIKETTEQLANGITEGADNLVASVNEAAEGALEGAKGLANKVSETATDTVNKVGDAVNNATAMNGTTASGSSNASSNGMKTGGRMYRKK
jgi:hypothetical protein